MNPGGTRYVRTKNSVELSVNDTNFTANSSTLNAAPTLSAQYLTTSSIGMFVTAKSMVAPDVSGGRFNTKSTPLPVGSKSRLRTRKNSTTSSKDAPAKSTFGTIIVRSFCTIFSRFPCTFRNESPLA